MSRPESILDDKVSVILTDDTLDADRLIFEGIDVGKPWFSVSEIARFFFARTPHWIRWRESRGFFVLDGEPIATKRTKPPCQICSEHHLKASGYDHPYKPSLAIGQRRYNLADVEKIAHALAEKGAISSEQLRLALHLVKAEGRLWQYLA